MKRFISALSSLVIAATAMGGTFALSTDAATNGSVSKTIIEIAAGENKGLDANGKAVTTINAKAGDTIPVYVYVPQSSGINILSLKFTVNGDKTKGEGTVRYPALDDPEYSYYYKTVEGQKHVGDAGKVAKNENLFGNYGIQMKHTLKDSDGNAIGYPVPYCFDSGYYSTDKGYGSGLVAGKYTNAGTVPFMENTMNVGWKLEPAMNKKKNADAYAPAEAWLKEQEAAGEDMEDLDYSSYTPVTTWTEDEAWARKYPFLQTSLVLPDTLPDGEYVFGVYTEPYINIGGLFDIDLKTQKDEVPKLNPTVTSSSVGGVDGKANVEYRNLTIKVGEGNPQQTDPPVQTTEPPKQTDAPTTNPPSQGSEDVPAGTVVYNFLLKGGKQNGFGTTNGKGNPNTAYVTPGETGVQVDLVVSNDPGTSGMQLYFSFDENLTFKRRKNSTSAYQVNVTWNEEDYSYVWTTDNGKQKKAPDNSVMSSFIFDVPETIPASGLKLDLNYNSEKPNSVRPEGGVDEYPDIPFIFHGLTLLEDKGTTTTEPPTTEPPTTEPPTTEPPTTEPPTTEPPTTEPPTTEPPTDAVWGDVNCSGDVRINDVVLLNKYLAGNATVSPQGLINANVNHNLGPDQKDSVKIKAYLAQLIPQSELAVTGDYAG